MCLFSIPWEYNFSEKDLFSIRITLLINSRSKGGLRRRRGNRVFLY